MRGKEMFKRVTLDEIAEGDIFILPPDKKTNKLRLSARTLRSKLKLEQRGGLEKIEACITKAPANEMFVITEIAKRELTQHELISFYAQNTIQQPDVAKQISRIFFRPITSLSPASRSFIPWVGDICSQVLSKSDPMMLSWVGYWRSKVILNECASSDLVKNTRIPDLAINVIYSILDSIPSNNLPKFHCQNPYHPSYSNDSGQTLTRLRDGSLMAEPDFREEITNDLFKCLVVDKATELPSYYPDFEAVDFPAFKDWLKRGAVIIRPVSEEALTFLLYKMFAPHNQTTTEEIYAANIATQVQREKAALEKLKEACIYDLKRLEQRAKYWLKFPQQLKKRGQKAATAFEKLLKERTHD